MAALLSILFYSQILLHYGLFTVFGSSQVVDSLSYLNFIIQMPKFAENLFLEWTTGLPSLVIGITGIGLLLFFFINKKIAKQKFSIIGTSIIVWVILIVLQRPMVISRIWLWMLPIILIGSSAGWLGFLGLVENKNHSVKFSYVVLSIFVVCWAFSAVTFVFPTPYERENNTPIVVTEYLKSKLTDKDIVVLSMKSDARFWYYFNAYNIPQGTIRGIKKRPFEKAYVIIYPKNETLENVLDKFGPDQAFLNLATINKIYQYNDAQVYTIDSTQTATQLQFQDKSNK
jgi:hypothetical protein